MAGETGKAGTRRALTAVAREKALLPFRGGEGGNIALLVAPFPKWSVAEADRLWCAAFVLHCCREAGFDIPYSPAECVTCSLAGCGGWEEYAMADPRIQYHRPEEDFTPAPGDIVLYNFGHTGVVEAVGSGTVTAIEGNTSPGTAGSQDNGGMVCRRTRKTALVTAYLRPLEEKEANPMDNTPSPAHKEGVEWAVKNGILTGDAEGDLKLTEPVTRQQMCTMLKRLADGLEKK